MTTQITTKSKRWPAMLALLFLLLLGAGLTSVLDEQALVSSAYSWPMLAFRGITYLIIFVNAKRKTWMPILACAVLNEMMIAFTYTGALTLW